jgi:chromosome partitioning protein
MEYMHIVAVCAQKGGVSKTTISQCLAIEALKEGRRAVIVDTDPQGSCAKWGQRREAKGIPVPAVIHACERPMHEIIEELRSKRAAAVFIDTPPLVTPALNAALEVATASVLVTRPNPLDLDALVATWTIVRRFSKKAAAVITQAPPGGRAKALGLAMERLKKLDIPTCETALSYSLSYPYAQAESLAPQEREPSSKARAELAEVWGELKRAGIV